MLQNKNCLYSFQFNYSRFLQGRKYWAAKLENRERLAQNFLALMGTKKPSNCKIFVSINVLQNMERNKCSDCPQFLTATVSFAEMTEQV